MKKLILSITLVFASVIGFATGHVVTITHTNASCTPPVMMYSDGTATANVTGGVGPFYFSWTGPPAFIASGPTLINLYPYTYIVVVTDSSDMSTATDTVTILGPPVLTMTTSPNDTICSGESSSIYGTGSGGTPPYSYIWTGGLGSGAGPFTVSPTFPTSYTLTVTDANGCVTNGVATVIVNPSNDASFSYSLSPYCQGNGTIASPTYPPGSSPGIFSASPGLVFVSTVTGEIMVDASSPGTQIVTHIVAAAGGCPADTATNMITIDFEVTANFVMVPDSVNVNTFWTFDTSVGGLAHNWSFSGGTPSASTATSCIVTYSSPGTYSACLSVSNSSCTDSLCVPVIATGVVDPCMSLFHIGDDLSSSNPNAYTVYNLSYGAPLTYLWDFGDTTTSTLANPTHVYSTSTGPYLICLTVDNGSGCSHTFCDTIFSVDSLSRTTDPISFTVVLAPNPLSTGIHETASNIGVSVYPNPFTDNTTFVIQTSTINETFSFEMTDVLGKRVSTMNNISDKQFTVSRNGLQNGIYFYKIYDRNEIIGIGKVIIK